MGILDRLFGGRGGGGSTGGGDVDGTIASLVTLYDQPDVQVDGGLPLQSRQAEEVRALGRTLAKSGGKPQLEAARDGLRDRVPWAAQNLEAIWASLPEWRA